MNREREDGTADQGYGSTPRDIKLKGRRYLIMIRQDGKDHVGYWPVVRDGGKLVVSDTHPAPGHPVPGQRGGNSDYLISPVHSHPKALEVQKELQTLDNVFDEVETMVNRLKLGDRWGRNVKQSHLPVMIPRVKSRTPEGFHQGSSANHASDYERLLVKIKHALNMLGRLREYIMQPNAPELVHTLFSLLAALKVHNGVIERTAPLVLEPMLTPAATKLLQNCLSSREMQLWQSLGSAWTTPSEGAAGHKSEMYAPPWHYNERIERPVQQLQRPSPSSRRNGGKDDVLFDYHDETSSEDQSTGVHTVTKNFGEKFSTIGSDYYSRQSSTTHSLASLSLDDEDEEDDRKWRRWKVDPKTFESREPDTDSVATDSSWTAVWINTDKPGARPKRENWNHYKSPEAVVADLKHKHRASGLDKTYSPKEVAKWMKKHGFSRSSIDAFQGLDAERLHGLTKREMEIVCPEEGSRLYNLIAG